LVRTMKSTTSFNSLTSAKEFSCVIPYS
jgi:hypothetical protein